MHCTATCLYLHCISTKCKISLKIKLQVNFFLQKNYSNKEVHCTHSNPNQLIIGTVFEKNYHREN